MRSDINGVTPELDDVIAYTHYNSTTITLGKIIGETKSANPKVIGKNKWYERGAFAIQSEFVIVSGIDPNTII